MDKEIEIYKASDYAGLKTKEWNFYYGYEEVVCKKHNNNFSECREAGCESNEWAFVATKNDIEIIRYPTTKLEKIAGVSESMAQYLLVGIAKMIEEKLI